MVFLVEDWLIGLVDIKPDGSRIIDNKNFAYVKVATYNIK